MNVTPLDVARRFLNVEEVEGATSNPLILAMLKLDGSWPKDDAVPWCSAFVNFVAWLLGLSRSKSLSARSWLLVGSPIALVDAQPGFDVVVLKRGGGNQPGPEVTSGASGHVGFYVGRSPGEVHVLGGNQSDAVTVARYPIANVLGVRRLS